MKTQCVTIYDNEDMKIIHNALYELEYALSNQHTEKVEEVRIRIHKLQLEFVQAIDHTK